MANRKPRNPAPAASAACAPATSISLDDDGNPPPEPFDADGFDPAEFEWRPVPRRPRADGWTPDVQRGFIQALADTGMVEEAARSVDMSVQSAYRLRTAPGGESFARAWKAALAAAAERVLDLAFARAIQGEDTPVFDRDGCRVGARWKTNDRMTMFLLRAYMPDRFRHAHESMRHPAEPTALLDPPVHEAVAALTPPPPVDPHLLLPPERLEALVLGARGVEEVHALYPPDDRARYVAPRVEADHPAAIARARARAGLDDPDAEEIEWDDDYA